MSAVILVVIVVMWAVVLVPMWLRRHDAATETRSVDRFSAAMRVLSRRQPAAASGSADRRYVLMPRRESAASVHVSGAAARSSRVPSPPPVERPAVASAAAAGAAPRRRRKASLAVRRRRLLLGLLGVAFLVFVLAVAGVVGWILQLVVDLIVVAFVVHLRTQAKRSAALARQRRRTATGSASGDGFEPERTAPTAVTPTAARYAARMARAAAPVAAEPAYESAYEPAFEPVATEPAYAPAAEPVAAEVASYDEPMEAAAEATGTDDGSAWEPVPVPRPTYTMKPPAPPRRYPPVRPDSDDVATADGFVDGDVGDEAVAARAQADDDGQLDEILTHRWAVND